MIKSNINRVKIIRLSETNITKQKLIKLLAESGVNFSKCYLDFHKQFVVICNGSDDVDKIFSDNCIQKLQEIGCKPVLPPELQARRAAILRYCDDMIYERSEDEIKEEIELKNTGIKVSDIFKFPKSKSIKITFGSAGMQSRICKNGLLLFHLSHPPYNIFPEIFIEIQVCYKCYEMNSHETGDCHRGDNFTVCSLCGCNSHTYKNCKSDIKKCLHCQGHHSSMALSCPVRKKLVKELRASPSATAKVTKTVPSFADVAVGKQYDLQTHIACRAQQFINKKTIDNTITSIVIASLKNETVPGVFEQTLNSLLLTNNISTFKMGSISPPKLIHLIANTPSNIASKNDCTTKVHSPTITVANKDSPIIISSASVIEKTEIPAQLRTNSITITNDNSPDIEKINIIQEVTPSLNSSNTADLNNKSTATDDTPSTQANEHLNISTFTHDMANESPDEAVGVKSTISVPAKGKEQIVLRRTTENMSPLNIVKQKLANKINFESSRDSEAASAQKLQNISTEDYKSILQASPQTEDDLEDKRLLLKAAGSPINRRITRKTSKLAQ